MDIDPDKRLTEAEAEKVRRLKSIAVPGRRWTLKDLMQKFGVKRWEIEKALYPDALERRRSLERRQAELATRPRQDRPAEIAEHGDLTARFFGDPPPGRSALDQKRQSQHG